MIDQAESEIKMLLIEQIKSSSELLDALNESYHEYRIMCTTGIDFTGAYRIQYQLFIASSTERLNKIEESLKKIERQHIKIFNNSNDSVTQAFNNLVAKFSQLAQIHENQCKHFDSLPSSPSPRKKVRSARLW